MNGRQRMATAMGLGEADRVPVMCQLAVGHYFLHSGRSPFDIWFRSEGFADALVALQRRYRFDGILVNLPGRDPDFEHHLDRVEEESDRGETRVRWKNGCYTVLPHDDNPHYFQGDGTRPLPALADVDPDRLFYVEPWDLTGITCPYRWSFDEAPRPVDDFFPPYHSDTIRAVKERTGEAVSVHGEVFSPLSQLVELLGCEAALIALLDDPGKVRACLGRLAEGAAALASLHVRAGADAILISSAFAGGGMISRAMYEDFVLPYERRVVTLIRERHGAVPVYTHTCGAIGDRLDLMLRTATKGIDSLDPPPLGTVDLEEAVRLLKGRAFVKGNVDPVNTLLRGDDSGVERAVIERIETAAAGGGFILSSACSVAPAVRPETMELFTRVAHDRGRY